MTTILMTLDNGLTIAVPSEPCGFEIAAAMGSEPLLWTAPELVEADDEDQVVLGDAEDDDDDPIVVVE
jgi:hypothetical protein